MTRLIDDQQRILDIIIYHAGLAILHAPGGEGVGNLPEFKRLCEERQKLEKDVA